MFIEYLNSSRSLSKHAKSNWGILIKFGVIIILQLSQHIGFLMGEMFNFHGKIQKLVKRETPLIRTS